MKLKTEIVSVVSALVDAGLLPELRYTFFSGYTCGCASQMTLDMAAVSALASAVQNSIRGEKLSRQLLNAVQRLDRNNHFLNISNDVLSRS